MKLQFARKLVLMAAFAAVAVWGSGRTVAEDPPWDSLTFNQTTTMPQLQAGNTCEQPNKNCIGNDCITYEIEKGGTLYKSFVKDKFHTYGHCITPAGSTSTTKCYAYDRPCADVFLNTMGCTAGGNTIGGGQSLPATLYVRNACVLGDSANPNPPVGGN